jgi:hypothetical protein
VSFVLGDGPETGAKKFDFCEENLELGFLIAWRKA